MSASDPKRTLVERMWGAIAEDYKSELSARATAHLQANPDRAEDAARRVPVRPARLAPTRRRQQAPQAQAL